MAYACGYFILGICLTEQAPPRFRHEIDYLVEEDLIEVSETSNGIQTAYIGVTLGGFIEGKNLLFPALKAGKDTISAAMADGSPQQIQYNNILCNLLLEDISDDFRQWLAHEEPQVFLTWSGS